MFHYAYIQFRSAWFIYLDSLKESPISFQIRNLIKRYQKFNCLMCSQWMINVSFGAGPDILR